MFEIYDKTGKRHAVTGSQKLANQLMAALRRSGVLAFVVATASS
jgi:hypothetical protein